MNRDRDRDRRVPLDIPLEDRYGTGGGQSYRPGGAPERAPTARPEYRPRSPPRRDYGADTYRSGRPRSRSPPRRDDFRRRSPSPRFRDRDARGGDTYRARPRSPTRREDLPRDDLFRKEPARDTRDFRDERDRSYNARSPPRQRDRSPVPLLKRGRDPSPYDNRDRRSPPPAKRERLDSPTRRNYNDQPSARPQSPPNRPFSSASRERRPSPGRDFGVRSRSPTRNERIDAREGDDWRRPRSPSPSRYGRQQDYHSTEENGDHSVATSRRSSPPLHPSRAQRVDDRFGRPAPRDTYDNREPFHPLSTEPRRDTSPPPREREYPDEMDYSNSGPSREPYRSDDQSISRPPPTGPAGYRAPSTSSVPPAGPSAGSMSMSAHARGPAVPPSGPRAAAGSSRGDFAATRGRGSYRGDMGPRGGFSSPSFRGGRGGAPPPGPAYGRGGYPGAGRSESYERESDYITTPTGPSSAGSPPAGPRGSFSQAPPPAFRQSSNTSTTSYPRTQRFGPNGQPMADPSSAGGTPTGPRASGYPSQGSLDRDRDRGPHPALSDLPTPIEGGLKAEPLVDRTKLHKLEEDAEKLRRIIDEKEAKKRKAVREWDRLSRETEAAAFRSQVAEEALRKGSGDVYADGAGAAF